MAAFSYDDYRASDHGGTFAAILNWGGAVLSLVLLAGLITWGWQLWVRDVTGVPVVRALEGPMRVQPDDPGGVASDYQGLSVNRLAESRAENEPAEQLVLAPAPSTLDEGEDLAMAELPSVAPEVIADAPLDDTQEVVVVNEPPQPQIGAAETFVLPEEADGGEVVAAAPAPVETTAEPESALSAIELAVAAALATDIAPPSPEKVEAAANVPVVSPRPLVRPVRVEPVALRPRDAIAVDGEVDPASVPAGTRLVQLGAYGSVDVARSEWDAVAAAYGSEMAGKTRIIQKIQSGERVFFRLRVMGFEGLSEARQFCAVLVAQSANCIPVVHE